MSALDKKQIKSYLLARIRGGIQLFYGNAFEQPPSAKFPERHHLSGQHQAGLRTRSELLFLPGGSGCLSHRGHAGSGRLLKVQVFLLYHGNVDFHRRSAGKICLRLSLPVRLVFRICCIKSRQRNFQPKKTQWPSLSEISHFGCYGFSSACACGKT